MTRFFIIFLILISANLTFGQHKFFVNDTILNDNVCGKITVLEFDPDTVIKGEYPDIDKILIIDDCIEMQITYGGGCGQVNCKLLAGDGIIKTLPPKVEFTLQFNDGDPCEALIREKIRFDLSPYENFAKTSGIYLLVNRKDYDLLYKVMGDN